MAKDVEDTRAFETTVELDAPVEAVWRALTDAEELVRWFPLEARVRPGAGGSVWISWGAGWEGEARIEIWEPETRLRTVHGAPGPYDVEGQHDGRSSPVTLALDYQLEGRGGRTVLRLVHSGFGSGAEWDDEFDSISRGWKFELRGLRHYLERHRGRDRRVVWVRTVTEASIEECWRRLTGRDGLAREGTLEGLTEGASYRVRTSTGLELSGVVHQLFPPRGLSGTVTGLNDALLRVFVETAGGKVSPQIWLSTWDLDRRVVQDLERSLGQVLHSLFGR
jgi:uncharacterized protein YndB with AHSA1/START domain